MEMKKKTVLSFCGLLIFVFLFVGCDTGNGTSDPVFVAVTDISCPQTVAIVGQGLTLSGTVEPSNATNKNIVWSAAEGVSNGVLTASSAKTYTVTATVTNGASESSSYTENFSIVAYDTNSGNVQTNPLIGKTMVMYATPPDTWVAKTTFSEDNTWVSKVFYNDNLVGVGSSGTYSWTGGTGIGWTVTYYNNELAGGGDRVPKIGDSGLAVILPDNKLLVANFDNSMMNGTYDFVEE